MRLYLVRHGESVSNKAVTQSSPDEQLSEHGQEQARFLANRFSNIKVDAIISSPYTRTLETAKSISDLKNIPVETNELVREFRWPTEFKGMSKKDPEVAKIRKTIEGKWSEDENWRHSDEETFSEIKGRAVSFLEFVDNIKQHESIVVVSHARFLKVLLAVMIHGKEVSGKSAMNILYRISLINTGITVAELHEGKWNLVTINDHAHLGDYHRQIH
jgi:broad specificity phosphatase PhoE